jgi:hypothetical protein
MLCFAQVPPFARAELAIAPLQNPSERSEIDNARQSLQRVDLSGSPGGLASATHGDAELEDTVSAVRKSVHMLRQKGEI